MQALVLQAPHFVVQRCADDHPVVRIDLMAHEADAASVVEHVFFQYGFALGAAARRGRCVDALGFFEPFRKIKTVGGDVGTIERKAMLGRMFPINFNSDDIKQ